MARLTSAQKKERAELERAETFARKAVEYPKNLMFALELATAQGHQISVVDEQFRVIIAHSLGYSYKTSLPYSPEVQSDIDSLEQFIDELNEIEAQREKEKRDEALRATALAKLTKEEKILLGLKP